MHNRKTLSAKPAQQGVVLVEAMIAILIFSMGVLAIVGLQAAMVKNTGDSKYRADASYIAQQRIGEIWADPDPALAGYVSPAETDTDISALLPGGMRTVIRSAPVYYITQPNGTQLVTAAVPAAPPYEYTYTVTVTVGWTAPGETPAASAATAPCFMLVAHCYTTITSIAGG